MLRLYNQHPMPTPETSVIVPCYNEAGTIRLLLDALLSQSYPLELMEIIIADGMSTDGTREVIAAYQGEHPDVHLCLVDNPQRIIPAALNRAIEVSNGTFIIRLDAHSRPADDYVDRCVSALNDSRGENVGGVWEIAPGADTPMARAIAFAAAHPLGVGDAQYRHTTKAQHVDTVPFGAFRRDLVDKIGPFDENLLTNEDYEFNVRIRQSGGRIWLDPAIRSTYYARPTLRELARQYGRYGFWKGSMLKRYPETLRLRQLLPPLFVAGLAGGGLLAVTWPAWRPFYALAVLLYALALLAAGLQAAVREKDAAMFPLVPSAIAVMHLCWGGALLWNLTRRK